MVVTTVILLCTLGFLERSAFVGPPNDSCDTATVIPSSAASYDPVSYSTVGADASPFEVQESCELGGVGVSNSVFYSFMPCGDGTISINTNGSDYNTVVSVFFGTCAFM